jgi:hypothetical protein
MNNEQLERVKRGADYSQRAVNILLTNPLLSSDDKSQLKFFLQNRLDNRDLERLSRLPIYGQVNFLRQRFHAYLAPR